MTRDRPPTTPLADAPEELVLELELEVEVPVEVPSLVEDDAVLEDLDEDAVVVELEPPGEMPPAPALPVAALPPEVAVAKVLGPPAPVGTTEEAPGTETAEPVGAEDWAREARGETARRARMASCLGEYILTGLEQMRRGRKVRGKFRESLINECCRSVDAAVDPWRERERARVEWEGSGLEAEKAYMHQEAG